MVLFKLCLQLNYPLWPRKSKVFFFTFCWCASVTSVTSRNSIQILPKVANSTAIPWIVFARPKSRYNSHFTPEWLSRNLKLKIQVILYNLWCVTGTRFKNLWWVYKILSLHKKKQIISLLSFSVTPTWILYYSRVAMVTSNQCHSIFLCLIYKLWEILKKNIQLNRKQWLSIN